MLNQPTDLQKKEESKESFLEKTAKDTLSKTISILLAGGIIAVLSTIIAIIYTLPFYLYLPLGALVFIFTALGWYIFSFRPANKHLLAEIESLKEEKTNMISNVFSSDAPSISQSQTQIDGLKKTNNLIRENHERQLTALRARHDDELNQRDTLLDEVDFLIDRVRKERADISDYVELSLFEIEQFKDEDVKNIIFRFLIKNKSVFDITLDNKIEGYIQIRNITLRGEKGFVSNYEIAKSAGHKWFFIEHSLSEEKFEVIKKLKDIKLEDFDLAHLDLTIKGTKDFPQVQPQKLKINRLYEKDRAQIVSYKGEFKVNDSVIENPKELIEQQTKSPAQPTIPDISIKLGEPFYTEYKQVKHRVVGVEITNNSDYTTAKIQAVIQTIEESSAFGHTQFPSKYDTLEPSYLIRKGHPYTAKETSFFTVARQSTEDLEQIMITVDKPQIIPNEFGMTVYSLEFDVSVIRDVFGHCYASKRVALYLNADGLIEIKDAE